MVRLKTTVPSFPSSLASLGYLGTTLVTKRGPSPDPNAVLKGPIPEPAPIPGLPFPRLRRFPGRSLPDARRQSPQGVHRFECPPLGRWVVLSRPWRPEAVWVEALVWVSLWASRPFCGPGPTAPCPQHHPEAARPLSCSGLDSGAIVAAGSEGAETLSEPPADLVSSSPLFPPRP